MAAQAPAGVVFCTGKGGTGKTTVSLALGLAFAGAGERVVVVEVSGGPHPALDGRLAAGRLRRERIDPDQALLEWLAALGGRLPARMLAARSSFRLFAAAAPGTRELLALNRIMELAGQGSGFDRVIVDAPASGHARALWRAPATFSAIAKLGPIAARSRELEALIADPDRCSFVAVARPLELAVSETLELAAALERDLGHSPAVVVNGVLPRSFGAAELAGLDDGGDPVVLAALEAARHAARRYRRERRQVARLRRAGLAVVELPLLADGVGDEAALSLLAKRLAALTRSPTG